MDTSDGYFIVGSRKYSREKKLLEIFALSIWSKCLLSLNYFYILMTFFKLLGQLFLIVNSIDFVLCFFSVEPQVRK